MEGLGVNASIFIRLAIAIEALSTTSSAPLNIAAFNVEFALDDATIMTGPTIGAPVLFFLTVANTRHLGAIHYACGDQLRRLNFLWPTLDHRHAAVIDFRF
jgi:hypothetical protein